MDRDMLMIFVIVGEKNKFALFGGERSGLDQKEADVVRKRISNATFTREPVCSLLSWYIAWTNEIMTRIAFRRIYRK